MTEEEKMVKIKQIVKNYLEGLYTSEESLNAIVLIVVNNG